MVEAVSGGSACLLNEIGVHNIEVEGDMERVLALGVQVLQSLVHYLPDAILYDVVHAECFHLMLVYRYILVIVDVPDANHHEIIIRYPLVQPLEPRQVEHTTSM